MEKVNKIKAKVTKVNKTAKQKLTKKHLTIVYITLGVLLLIVGTAGFLAFQYRNKAVPGTNVAGVNVGGKTELEIRDIVENLRDSIKLNLIQDEKVVIAHATDLGIDVDINQTAANAIAASSSGNVFSTFNPLVTKRVNLVVNYDNDKAQEFINTNFPDSMVEAQDATIVYNDKKGEFEVVAGSVGRLIDAKKLKGVISDLVARPRVESIRAESADVLPVVDDQAATEARDYMNERLNLRINFNYQGKTLYFIDPPDIANMVDLERNIETGKLDVVFSSSKIEKFISDKLTPSLSIAPKNAKVLVNRAGEQLTVISAGHNGLVPTNVGSLTAEIKQALVSNTPLGEELTVVEREHGTEKIVSEDGRWIDTNLSTFTVTLYEGATPVFRTSQIATGKSSTPTITGAFQVYLKYSVQTMKGGSREKGDYYEIPGVKWITYWGAGGYAFHTASWLGGQERTRISHGCVNMHEADAKRVYDFASIGTWVFVHY